MAVPGSSQVDLKKKKIITGLETAQRQKLKAKVLPDEGAASLC